MKVSTMSRSVLSMVMTGCDSTSCAMMDSSKCPRRHQLSRTPLILNSYLTRAFSGCQGSTRARGGDGGGHKVPAAFFFETVKATAIKLGTLINWGNTN